MGDTNFTSVDTSEGYKVGGSEVVDSSGEVKNAAIKTSGVTSTKLANGAVTPAKAGVQLVALQGSAELDLTDNTDETEIVASGSIPSSRGGEKLIPVRAYAVVTTEIAADSTAPVVKIQDSDDNDVNLDLDTLADADSADAVRLKEISDGDDMTPVDITSKGLKAAVTTAAADAATAAGKCKVIVECMLVK
jgi:hypothetical protein